LDVERSSQFFLILNEKQILEMSKSNIRQKTGSVGLFDKFPYMHVNKNPKSCPLVVDVHTRVITSISTNTNEELVKLRYLTKVN
jgi:hypothetical protein